LRRSKDFPHYLTKEMDCRCYKTTLAIAFAVAKFMSKDQSNSVGGFCWAKLDHRIHSSTLPAKRGNV
jgi:hypothetical protein